MFSTLVVLEGRIILGSKLEIAFDVIGEEIDVLIDDDEIGVCFNSYLSRIHEINQMFQFFMIYLA